MTARTATRGFTAEPRLLPAGLALAGAALLSAAFAPEIARAHAVAATATTCEGSQTVAYSPGLSATPREITIHGTSTLSHCASSADPGITAGRSAFHAKGRLSCTSGTYTGTREITWDNGRTSRLSFRSVVSADGHGGSVVATRGEVTGGRFAGQKWSAAFTMFAVRPHGCATAAGVPTVAGRLRLGVGSPFPGLKVPERSRPVLR
jgi:hypothetical protein